MAFKYRAFISYSHTDEAWGKWLHQKLERYRVPRHLVGKPGPHGAVPRRIGRCFRDQAELSAASDLGERLQQALRDAQVLIVVCSPRAARSPWVNEEIEYFRSLGRGRDIYALIVDGSPHAADADQECFPDALRSRIGGLQFHPLAADARPGKDGKGDGFLKLAAGIIGVEFDELRRREQRRRYQMAAALVIASAGIATATSALAVFAYQARNQARFEQAHAEHAKDFLLSVFREQDPTLHTTQKQRTPLQLVVEATKRLDTELGRDPQLHAELTEELGVIRGNLGDPDGARGLLRRALAERQALFGQESVPVARTYIELANLEDRQKGDQAPEVAGDARSAMAILRDLGKTETLEEADAERVLARTVGSSESGTQDALAMLEHAQGIYERLLGAEDQRTVATVMARASVLTDARRFAPAESLVANAIERLERGAGPNSINLSYPLRLRAYLLGQQGRSKEAASAYARAAQVQKSELGSKSAVLADTLGRLAVELYRCNEYAKGQRAFGDAENALPDQDDHALQDLLAEKVEAELEAAQWREMASDAHREFLLLRKLYGDRAVSTWTAAANEGRALSELGAADSAGQLLQEAIAKVREISGPASYDNWYPLTSLGAADLKRHAYQAAIAPFREALELATQHFAKTSFEWAESAANLGEALMDAGNPADYAQADSLLSDAIDVYQRLQSRMPLADALMQRGLLRAQAGQRDKGKADLEHALKMFRDNGGNRATQIGKIEKALRVGA